jgi:hypothetical protein
MNIFILSNYVAWILIAVIAAFLLIDFLKNEITNKRDSSNKRRYSDEER